MSYINRHGDYVLYADHERIVAARDAEIAEQRALLIEALAALNDGEGTAARVTAAARMNAALKRHDVGSVVEPQEGTDGR